MSSLKAIALMVVVTGLVVLGINAVGLDENFRNPLYALITALILLVTLVVNVWIYLAVAGEAPFKWFREEA